MRFLSRKIPFIVLAISAFLISNCCIAQLEFVENKGQWNNKVDFRGEMQTGAFFLERNGFTVLLHNPAELQAFAEIMHGHSHDNSTKKLARAAAPESNIPSTTTPDLTIHSHAYKVSFVNASKNVLAIPDKAVPTFNNYFVGNDKSKWQSGCKVYQAVTYKNIYPNIDVRYYTDADNLKYDILVNPGGNINDIILKYEGVDGLSLKNNELIIGTSIGEIKELYPYTYQFTNGTRQVLDCKYVLRNNEVRFNVKNYSRNSTIVIDPTLVFSTFTGSSADNWGYTATPGPDGSLFAGGIAFRSGYPVSPGAFSQNFNGGLDEDNNGPYDIAIMKFSSNGASRLYATYLGGAGNEQPHSMICDAAGNLIVAGRTNSNNFPVTTPLVGPGGGYDIVVTKFNASGTALIGSMKIGGTGDDGVNIRGKYFRPTGTDVIRRNYGDDARSEVIIDATNNIYLASCTQSNNFPIISSGIQTSFGGGRQDGAILKLNANLSSIIFSTYFGGSGDDACFALSLSPLNNNIYVAGGTSSSNLPGSTSGTLNPGYQGGETDGFITIVNPAGSSIVKTTYGGTSGSDLIYGIQFDKFGFPYIMGTTSGNWPVVNATFSNPGSKQFVAKLQQDLSSFVYSTIFGTTGPAPNLSPVAFLVDRCQNVYVSGWGGGINFNQGYPSIGTGGMKITPDAIQSTGDGEDFYFFVLERDAQSQLFGSYFGQQGGLGDHVDGGTSRFDANGIIYQAICANCGKQARFPTTPGVWAPSNGSPNCNEAAVKIEMNFSGVGASVKATINGRADTIGCVPLTVTFTDTLAKGKKYIWHFGDNSPSVETLIASTSHEYKAVGSYRVMLVSIDSTTCNIVDTAYTTIKVGNNEVNPNFTPQKIGDCNSLTYRFVNTSTAVVPLFKPNSFLWDFGDGTTLQRAGTETITHTFPSTGTYVVKLIVDDTTFCNAPDTVEKTIRLAVSVKAQFTTPDKGCAPYTASFDASNSIGGLEFFWDFGDGGSSTEIKPIHVYNNVGTYTVKLIVSDSSTCNKVDSMIATITVLVKPVAGFNFSPLTPEPNRPVQFTNTSVGAVSYIWDFGDGETSTLTNPVHQFNATDTFTVCLQAINAAGCIDTICKEVAAIVVPLLDVPNAFTPGKFGVNSIISVAGFGISKMNWKIYNRWGQLIFETNSRKQGWDGTYKGSLQPMDVYTYTLEAEFFDGKKVRKTGDITLLR